MNDKGCKVVITGGTGLLGHHFKTLLPEATFFGSNDCDLRDRNKTIALFEKYSPEYVIHLAAKVGGIKANSDFIGDFYTDNILINTNVLDACKHVKVKKVLSVLSTCIYPDKPSYPLTEDQIHNGEPNSTNFGYAYAKRMLDVQSRAYRIQHNMNCITVVPNNLYGENDMYDLNNSHVIPALIHKIYKAKQDQNHLVVWGDGTVYREFSYTYDIACIMVWLMKNYDGKDPINIGCPEERLLKDVVLDICDIMEFKGDVQWDKTNLQGQLRKPSSNQKLLKLGWDGKYTDFKQSLTTACNWFVDNYSSARGVTSN